MFLNNIIEVFLFVNPLAAKCYETEKMIESFSTERDEKIRIRFIPLLNFHTVKRLMSSTTDSTLSSRNQLYSDSFRASLAFQAASMQGKKKGRKFLMALQDKVINERKLVTNELFLELAEALKLDVDMFEEDLHSDFSKTAFKKDQKLAQEMNITEAPSCVLYSGKDSEYGYRIDSSINKQLLHGFCNEKAKLKLPDSTRLSLVQMI